MTAASWSRIVQQARAVAIESEIARRGIALKRVAPKT